VKFWILTELPEVLIFRRPGQPVLLREDMLENNCYCCSGKDFEECCLPFLKGESTPLIPEELMRSRYTAYVLVNTDYLLETTHPSRRELYSRRELERWAKNSHWQKLEIIEAKEHIVTFKAYYRDKKLRPFVHHERSVFIQQEEKWYYVDGTIIE